MNIENIVKTILYNKILQTQVIENRKLSNDDITNLVMSAYVAAVVIRAHEITKRCWG